MKKSILYHFIRLLSLFACLPSLAATQHDFSSGTLSNTTQNNHELASAHFQHSLFVEELAEFSFSAQEFHEPENFIPFGELGFLNFQFDLENFSFRNNNLPQTEDLKKRILQHIFPFHFFF